MIEALKEAAGSAIDALKDNPMMLGVLVLNAMLFIGIYFTTHQQRATQAEQMKILLERCLPKGSS